MNRESVFITGVSSGIGHSLAELYLTTHDVYGLSRRTCDLPLEWHFQGDLNNFTQLEKICTSLSSQTNSIELIVLNAALLGPIERFDNISIEECEELMRINVWSNKLILDSLIKNKIEIKQVVFISSGASKSAYAGWGPYSVTKASLNHLCAMYAADFPQIQFNSLAPGIVDTAMQQVLCEEVDSKRFPSVNRLREARGTENMPTPEVQAHLLKRGIEKCLELENGSYFDVRQL